MAEVGADSPKPERVDASLPKVLVHQASESDKGEENIANDQSNGIISENGVDKIHADTPGTSPETGDNGSTADVTVTEQVDKPGELNANDSVEVKDEREEAGENADSPMGKEQQPATAETIPEQNENIKLTVADDNPTETAEESHDKSDAAEVHDEQPASNGTTTDEQASAANVVSDLTDADVASESVEQEMSKPEIPEQTADMTLEPKSTESTTEGQAIESGPQANKNENQDEMLVADDSTKPTTPPMESNEKTPEMTTTEANSVEVQCDRVLTPVEPASNTDEAEVPKDATGGDHDSDTLFEKVANGETELLSIPETPVPEPPSGDSVEDQPVHENKSDEERGKEADDGPTEETEQERSGTPKEGKQEPANTLPAKLQAEEDVSVCSDEKPEGEKHYDASVSGNEDDSPENVDTEEKATNQTNATQDSQIATTEIAKQESETRGETLSPTNDDKVQHSPARSPKMVKFSGDTKDTRDSDSGSDVVVIVPVETKHTQYTHEIKRETSDTPDPLTVTASDLEELEEKESPIGEFHNEEDAGRDESNSRLSIQADDDIQMDSEPILKSESPDPVAKEIIKFEQYKKDKESETDVLNERIRNLQDEINRLEEEKTAERQKVDSMSLQIKRMTDDNSENVKMINSYEQKIPILEEQIEKYKTSLAHHEQQNGNANAAEHQPPKKSSVCVIL